MTALQTTNFSTTDGLKINIDQYTNYSIYRVTDQDNNNYKVTIRELGKQFVVQTHFVYDKAVEDGYSIYSETERKKRHLGTIIMSKDFSNSNDAEMAAIDAVRKIGKLIPQHLIFLNEIENSIMEIKANPNSEKIPYLLNIIQIQLNYLMNMNKPNPLP